MKFCKMNGCGNDYVFVYLPENPIDRLGELAKKVSDRHYGIGSDGLIVIDSGKEGDFRMRVFNADGSEAAMCGNAIRCAARWMRDEHKIDRDDFTFETRGGLRRVRVEPDSRPYTVRVDMGIPRFFGAPQGETAILTHYGAVSAVLVDVGNPHAVLFTDKICDGMMRLAEEVSQSDRFPDGINVEVASVESRDTIRMRVIERGSGETLACGTGATAVAFVAKQKGWIDRSATVVLKGGSLTISFEGDTAYMAGDANYNFRGEYQW